MAAGAAARAELDPQYNLRAAVPTFQAYFDHYDRLSASFRARAWARLDLAYGDGERQAVDLYLPERPDPPLLVFIHGGYWHSQDRVRFAFVGEPLVAAGAAVALLGYDLAPAVDMDAIVMQVRRGLAFLWRRAGDLSFDRGRLFVSGHSAGGHLTAMLLTTDWPAHAGLPPDPIRGALTISGIFDLEPIRRCYLNDVLALDAAQARRNSPLLLPQRVLCPVIAAVGGAETPAFLEQSRRYVRDLQDRGLDAQLRVLPGLDHFAIVAAMGERGSALVGTLSELMDLPAPA